LPGVGACRCAAAGAPKKIEEEDELHGGEEKCRRGDAPLDGDEVGEGFDWASELGVVARLAGESRIVHREERAVGGDEGDPEMDFAQGFVHAAAC